MPEITWIGPIRGAATASTTTPRAATAICIDAVAKNGRPLAHTSVISPKTGTARNRRSINPTFGVMDDTSESKVGPEVYVLRAPFSDIVTVGGPKPVIAPKKINSRPKPVAWRGRSVRRAPVTGRSNHVSGNPEAPVR